LVIEHAFLADREERARATRLGGWIMIQPALLYSLGSILQRVWGAERVRWRSRHWIRGGPPYSRLARDGGYSAASRRRRPSGANHAGLVCGPGRVRGGPTDLCHRPHARAPPNVHAGGRSTDLQGELRNLGSVACTSKTRLAIGQDLFERSRVGKHISA
jgi:hypothetical protein